MSDIKTTEIEQIKEILRDIDHLPWQYVELGRNIEHDAIKNADGKTVFGISSYLQENADFLLLAVNNISSIITTIESQQKDIDRLDHWEKFYKRQSDHHEREAMTYQEELTKSMEQVESQKEEIEQLEEERDQALKDYESACTMSSDNSRAAIKLSDEVESLKAITELAVKGLKWYADKENYIRSENDVQTGYPHEIMWDKGSKASTTLSEIEKLQNE